MPIRPLPEDLRRRLVRALLAVPNIDDRALRRTYLHGALPAGGLPGVTEYAETDVIATLRSLNAMGTLTGGRWPILMLLDQMLDVLPDSDVTRELVEVRSRIEDFYAASGQPTASRPQDVELQAAVGVDDSLPFTFIEKAMTASRSVALVSVDLPDASPSSGTGWLLSPTHAITNWHVVAPLEPACTIDDLRMRAQYVTLRFDYLDDIRPGTPASVVRICAASQRLDYAILELQQLATPRQPLTVRRAPPLAGARLNILQHPLGRPLTIALRENDLLRTTEPDRLHYLTDTRRGASGAPVFDDLWRVVALHHAAVPVDVTIADRTYSMSNEGIPMAAIVSDLPATIAGEITYG